MDDKEKQYAVLFLNLVMWFQAMAMQQMGKLKNPVSDKIERDMEQARLTIDMLDMLHAKTKGNLDEEEGKFFNHILSELKLNFVDELNKDKKAAAAAPDAPAASQTAAPQAPENTEPARERAAQAPHDTESAPEAAAPTKKSDEPDDDTTPA